MAKGDAPTHFTPHQVAVIEAALINAKFQLAQLNQAQVDFGNGWLRIDHSRQLRELQDALTLLGFPPDFVFEVPASPKRRQKR